MPKCRLQFAGFVLLAGVAFSVTAALAPQLWAQPAIQANATAAEATARPAPPLAAISPAVALPQPTTPPVVTPTAPAAAPVAPNALAPAITPPSALEQGVIKKKNSPPSLAADAGVKKNPLDAPGITRSLASLALVLAAIGLAAWAFRRFVLRQKKMFAPGAVEILARTSVSPRQSLCLVKLSERLLLVGVSPNHLAALDRIENPEEVARILGLLEKNTPKSITNSFTKLFHRESEAYEAEQPPDGAVPMEDSSADQLSQARGELGQLLDKVRGLTRIKDRQ